jgi:CHAT domain-containing protein/Tfp pilus assembly protein PilF
VSYIVFMLRVRSGLAHSRIVGCLRRWKLQSWALLWVILSFPLASRPAMAINFAQNRPAEGASPAREDKRAAAQQAFEAAQRLRSEGTAASLKSALEKYQQALGLWHEVGDQRWEATTLNNIGQVYNSLGEKQKALDYYNQALPIRRAVGNRSGEATTLNNIGMVYDSLGEKQKALDYYNQALPIERAVGYRSGEATTLNSIGLVYNSLGEKQKALDYYNQALPMERAVGDRSMEATTLSSIGLVYNSLGEKQKALDYYHQALPIERAVGNRSGEATTLNNIGRVYDSLGEKQKALDYYNQALPISRAVGNRFGEAVTLNNIGLVYSSLGENQKALDYYNQALPIQRAVGNRSGEATTLNNIGRVYDSLGEKQKALDYYNQALLIHRAVADRSGEAATLNNIGLVYSSLGEKQKALDYYNQALPISRAVGDRSGEATTLNNIGLVYNSLGEKQKALDYYNQALPIHRAVADRSAEATTLNNIGLVYSLLGEKQKALDYYNQALPIERAVGYRSMEATTLNNIGLVYSSLGEKQKALDYYNQALPIERAVGYRSMEATTLGNIANLNLSMGQLIEARSGVEEALAIIESLRTKLVSPDLRTSYFSSQTGYYDFYVEVLMQLHRLHPAEGYDRLAFEASERGKARSLLDLLNEAEAHIYRGADPRFLEHEATIRQQLDALAQLQTKLLNGPHAPQQLNKLEQRLRELTTQYEQAESEIRQNSPQYAALTQPHPASVNEIQQQLLDSDTVLLEYALGRERSYLWLVTPTTFTSYELPKRLDINQASRQAYALLTARTQRRVQADKEYESAAAGLSNLLLGKVGSQLGHQRLLIVADGALNYVPFSALPAPENEAAATATTGSKTDQLPFVPLLVNHEVIQLPSASVLGQLRRETASRQPPSKQVFVMADPVFSPNDPRVKHSDRQPGSTAVAQNRAAIVDDREGTATEVEASQLARSAGDAGVIRGGEALPRLLGTREEAKSIVALAPAQSKLVLDFEASRATATSAELSQYRYLHFATHGLVDTQHPELSGLVLSMVNQEGKPVNGFLRLQDIFNLNLPVELVVLSACETGIGKEVRGEGLMGLTRGFMYAGSPRVMVSLWKVDDAATAELMGRFYDGMLRQKLRPAAALRAAQLAMWQDSGWRAPYYWAAFVLQGEWN